MTRHPTLSTLRRNARRAAGERSGRIAAHILACPACRARHEALAAVITVARAMPAQATPPGDFPDVLRRVRAGESIVLPVETGLPPRTPFITRRRAAVGVAAIAAVALILTAAPEARAMWSELAISPARPQTGSPITLEYRAAALLESETRLRVRARVRTAADARTARTVDLGTITRGQDGRFRGVVTLADSIVYAVLSIESEDGLRLDVNGERWEVLVHGADGRPLVTALLQRRFDASHRDTRIEREVADQLVALYPGRPEGWDALWIADAVKLGNAAVDSLRAFHRQHHLPALETALAADPNPDARALGAMVFYTSRLADSSAMQRWKSVLYERHPDHGFALMWRTFDLDEANRGDPGARLLAYERMWDDVGPASSQLTLNAMLLAGRLGDSELVRIWGERMERADSSFTEVVANTMARMPELRREAIARMRAQVQAALDTASVGRPLRYTVSEYRQLREQEAGALLSRIGVLLLAEGDTVEALHALRRAATGPWDAQRFRSLGEIHLSLGDTASALAEFSRAAVDPFMTSSLVDTLRARLETIAANEWDAARADASRTMIERTWGESIRRKPALDRVRLLGQDGKPHEHELNGTVTVIAFWSRYCPYSVEQINDLDRISSVLVTRGVRVLVVTDESDPGAVATYLRDRGAQFSTWLDIDRDAHNAFDNRGTPTYFVLDRDGILRFTGHSPAAVPRQVEALLAMESSRDDGLAESQ